MNEKFYGSICLSDIPPALVQEVETKDGSVKDYLPVVVGRRAAPDRYGHTHYVKCRLASGGQGPFIGSLTDFPALRRLRRENGGGFEAGGAED